MHEIQEFLIKYNYAVDQRLGAYFNWYLLHRKHSHQTLPEFAAWKMMKVHTYNNEL